MVDLPSVRPAVSLVCGAVRVDGDERTVVLVAERTTREPDGPPEDASWGTGVVAVTGWPRDRADVIDWTPAETRLGTALPGDQRRLAGRFGYGAFDGWLSLLPTGGPPGSLDIVETSEF